MDETEGWKCFARLGKNCLIGHRERQHDLLRDYSQEWCLRDFPAKALIFVLFFSFGGESNTSLKNNLKIIVCLCA